MFFNYVSLSPSQPASLLLPVLQKRVSVVELHTMCLWKCCSTLWNAKPAWPPGWRDLQITEGAGTGVELLRVCEAWLSGHLWRALAKKSSTGLVKSRTHLPSVCQNAHLKLPFGQLLPSIGFNITKLDTVSIFFIAGQVAFWGNANAHFDGMYVSMEINCANCINYPCTLFTYYCIKTIWITSNCFQTLLRRLIFIAWPLQLFASVYLNVMLLFSDSSLMSV